LNHLHKDCPKRAAANAAAAAKKAVAGAQAYVAELHNDEDDSIIFVEIPAGDPLPAKTTATAGSTAAVVVDYIGLALQFSAFGIILAVLALVLFDSPSLSPPVSAGVFAVLTPALMPQSPATDWTAWICSAIAIGVALLILCRRQPQGTSSTKRKRKRKPKRAPPTVWTPELAPCRTARKAQEILGVKYPVGNTPG
jgi:hypothetical protein